MKFEQSQESLSSYELPREIKNPEAQILAEFNPEQKREIKSKQKILSSVAYFIGKDFKIPVELNAPGAGWHWDFKNNVIRIDPRDLLEKPMEYLHFVIAHEGGHRRVSRVDFIPNEVWQQPGFSFMMNAIEDPRMNNFVADKYPKFREDMKVAYELMAQIEEEMKQKARGELGFQPRFKQAGFEYIRQWFRETQGKKFELSKDLPEDVLSVVKQTLPSAQYSWSVYPSPEQADKSEELITDYARVSYEINRDEVWPEFKKLVEKDKADQEAQEFLQDQKKTQGGRGGEGDERGEVSEGEGSGEQSEGRGLPQELKDKLTSEELDSLEKAIDKSIEQNKENDERDKKGVGRPIAIDLDSLSPELKQKIQDYIKSLPEDKKSELSKRAEEALQQFERDFTEKMQGKLNQKEESDKEKTDVDKQAKPESPEDKEKKAKEEREKKELRETLRKILESNQTEYDSHIRELSWTIFDLENRLRNIFRERKARRFEAGKKSGSRVNIKKRISELAKEVPPFKSRSWERREMPSEKDYAISLLIDLSGSMRGNKIGQAFRAVIVLAEVLNRLSIKTEILGFNDRLHEYQAFSKSLTEEVRSKIGTMVGEVNSDRAMYNDDGWAVQEASKRLARQDADQKFLVVLSDGTPEESSAHSGSEYDLETVVKNILSSKKQKIVGLGLGSGTDHVRRYYPKSIAGIPVGELPEKLAELLKDIVENYDKY